MAKIRQTESNGAENVAKTSNISASKLKNVLDALEQKASRAIEELPEEFDGLEQSEVWEYNNGILYAVETIKNQINF